MLSFALALVMPQVTLNSLVRDGLDFSTLCEYPDPPYTTKQASSYDRASLTPGNEAWFANKDWGNYVRTEQNGDRQEFVLADVKGPGAMVRYWTPNPTGITRIYVDGNATPVIEAKTADLLSGKVAPFNSPVAQETSKGWSLYCPVTYQDSLKVTIDNSDGNAERMYYQVQYRTYAPSVSVEKFSIGEIAKSKLAERLNAIPAMPLLSVDGLKEQTVAPGATMEAHLKGSTQITAFIVHLFPEPNVKEWTDPRLWHNMLRSLRVVATFDGEKCVDAPLGDLIGSQAGVWQMDSLPVSSSRDGVITLRFPMAFEKDAHFSILNTGDADARFRLSVVQKPYKWTENSMHFKAQWLCYKGSTRPMADLSFLNAQGQGVFVGCNVAISNPTPDWWGEGDEKIFQDGETFPSTFGTGTEDYFGYGWSNPALFNHPYHYQSHCDGPGTKGHSSIGRWQILDRIPFQNSLKFDMELWHWADVQMQYGRTAYWYAKPGGSAPISDDPSRFPLPYIESGIKRVKGAVEGEEMKVLVTTGGNIEVQDFDSLSNGKQVWWRDASKGNELKLGVPVAKAGKYRVMARCCFAADYGVHSITFGSIRREIDFFGKLSWKTIDLGVTHLEKGEVPLHVWVEGANPKAEQRHMFGMDYILLMPEN